MRLVARLGLRAAKPLLLGIALLGSGAVLADPPPRKPEFGPPAPMDSAALAERVYRAGMAEQRAAVIAAESAGFADRMGQQYLDYGSGPDWRAEVARIHDAARVSALLLAAIEARLAEGHGDADLLAGAMGVAGVSGATDGQGLYLAARVALSRPGAAEAAQARIAADPAAHDALHRLMHGEAMTGAALAARMNREIAFARGFAQADGFAFPTRLEDVARDLSLQRAELRAEERARIEAALYAAFAPLGAQAFDRIAVARQDPGFRAVQALMALAEGDVMDQLAAETGRAAARRQEGDAL